MINKHAIDLIYIKRLRLAQFVPTGMKIPVLLDTTDAMSLFYKRAFVNVPWHKKILYLIKYKTYG